MGCTVNIRSIAVTHGFLRHLLPLFALLMLGLPGRAAAAVAALDQKVGHFDLGTQVEYLEDVNGKLALSDVITPYWQQKFRASQRAVPNFGFTQSVYWFKVTLRNPHANAQEWFMDAHYPVLDRIDAYYVRGGEEIRHLLNGDRIPFSQREFKHRSLVFDVELAPGDQIDVYLRVRTDSSLQLPLHISKPQQFFERDQRELYALGLYYGVMFAMLIYNLLIYSVIRDRNYLYYTHYIVGYALFQLSLNGFALQYLWPDYPAWGNVATPFFIGVAFLGAVTFARSFLQLKTQAPNLDLLGKILWSIFLFVTVGSLFLSYSLMIQIATATALAAAFYEFVSGLMVWRGQLRQARYFLLAWTALLLGIVMYALKTFNIVPANFATEYGLQIGSTMEVILLSFALAHRMKILQSDYTRIQEEAKNQLEQRVLQRTSELDDTLRKLSDANSKLRSLNFTDGLTGVRNRKYFDQKIRKEWERAQRGGYFLTVMLIDLDHFKKINDTYGHQAGDLCLKSVASTVQSTLKRPCDVVARYGGEEFVVILPLTDEAGAMHIAEGIRQEIAALQVSYEGWSIPLTASLGLCTIAPKGPYKPADVVAAADAALYRAKHNGRNQVQAGKPGDTPLAAAKPVSVTGH